MSYIGNSPGVASQRVETAFTATSNQTAFTPSSGYTLGYCDVYQNGVKLVNGDDYTASDGVTVTLATGAASGDSIVIVASFPRGLSDGYLKSEADAKYVALTGAQTVAGVKTFSSQIVGIAGTAGAPAVTTTGDTDTGIFFPAANTLAFSTNGTEDARFDANGNFGIGTTSPSGRLHTAVADGATNALYAERTGASPVQFTVNFANQFSNLVSSSIMTFSTNGFTERARIDASGNLGVGTTSPTQKLDVVGSGAAIAMRVATTSGNAAFVETSASTGSVVARLQSNVDGAWSGTLTNHAYFFQTNGSERARIDTSGRLLVGQTSATHSTFQFEAGNSGTSGGRIGIVSLGRSGGDYPFVGYNFAFTGSSGNYVYAGADFASAFYFYIGGIYSYTANSGSAGSAISLTGGPYLVRGGTSWTNSSDERLKNITGEIQDGLAKVCALQAATYTWKHDEENTPQVGLIAQNVLTVVPEAVVVPEAEFNGKPETSMGVNYDRLIPVLVAAIKEQQAIIEQLQADVATLKGTP